MAAGGTDAAEPLRLGAVFGRYRVDALVGRGGMGVVFRATDLSLQRPVALKVLSPDLAADPAFRARFVRESRLAAAIEHPAIVAVYEAGAIGDTLYIAMRFVPGRDLGTILRLEAPLGLERTLLFLTTPPLWPCWPFLPVVRRTKGTEELGVVFDARAAGLTGLSSAVFLTNLFLLPPDLDAFLALPKEVFDSADEVADARWCVD